MPRFPVKTTSGANDCEMSNKGKHEGKSFGLVGQAGCAVAVTVVVAAVAIVVVDGGVGFEGGLGYR